MRAETDMVVGVCVGGGRGGERLQGGDAVVVTCFRLAMRCRRPLEAFGTDLAGALESTSHDAGTSATSGLSDEDSIHVGIFSRFCFFENRVIGMIVFILRL